MPNGYHGSAEGWERLEAPLHEIDAALEAFADRHGLGIRRNHHNWPERSLRWGDDPARLIQLSLVDEERVTWNLGICVWQDRGGQRFWKQRLLRCDVSMADLSPVIGQLLDEGFRTASSWRPEDLEFATNLRGSS